MPRKRTNQIIQGEFFAWKVYNRSGVFYADGRSNEINAGRHSLGTKDKAEASKVLRELDLVIAVKKGLSDASRFEDGNETRLLPIEKGITLYLKHVGRPAVTGGASAATLKRYRAILDKFEAFARVHGVRYWQGVDRRTLERYAAWLEDHDYAYATQYTELTTIKQAVAWMCAPDQALLPESARINMSLKKPSEDTSTYCYTDEEVAAMLGHCFASDDLRWLGEIIATLAHTGMRIGELAKLRWANVDLQNEQISIIDESQTRKRHDRKRATTKNRTSRTVPIHPELGRILNAMATANVGYVFRGPRGGELKPDTIRIILKRDVLEPLRDRFPSRDEASSFIDGRLHSFRHFACSKWAREGIGELTVRQWLGHKSSQIVRRYFHLHDQQARQQMASVSSIGEEAA